MASSGQGGEGFGIIHVGDAHSAGLVGQTESRVSLTGTGLGLLETGIMLQKKAKNVVLFKAEDAKYTQHFPTVISHHYNVQFYIYIIIHQ